MRKEMIRGGGSDIRSREGEREEGMGGKEGSLTARRSIHTDTLSVCQYTRVVRTPVCACVCGWVYWYSSVNPSLPHLTCATRALRGVFMSVSLLDVHVAFSFFPSEIEPIVRDSSEINSNY